MQQVTAGLNHRRSKGNPLDIVIMSDAVECEYSLRKKLPENRTISAIPPPFIREATPHVQNRFSPSAVELASKTRSLLVSKLSKMILIGDCGVGKTALVNRFCHDTFSTNYKATIGVDFEMERFNVLGVPFNLQIWDTAGQERFRCIAQSYYRDANVIGIVFDLTDPHTLTGAGKWMKEALESNLTSQRGHSTPLKFLIGTKSDLIDSEYVLQDLVQQSTAVSKQLGCELWIVSSKLKHTSMVSDLFLRIAALSFDRAVVDSDTNLTRAIGKGSIKINLRSSETKKLPSACVRGARCHK